MREVNDLRDPRDSHRERAQVASQPEMSRVGRHLAIRKPSKRCLLQSKRFCHRYASVEQRLNQAQPVVQKPEREQRGPVDKKSPAALTGEQHARNRREHQPVVGPNAVRQRGQHEIRRDPEADSGLPGLDASLEGNNLGQSSFTCFSQTRFSTANERASCHVARAKTVGFTSNRNLDRSPVVTFTRHMTNLSCAPVAMRPFFKTSLFPREVESIGIVTFRKPGRVPESVLHGMNQFSNPWQGFELFSVMS